MPISFEQPDAMNLPDVATAAGFPIRLQAREQLARERAAADAAGNQANENDARSRAAAGGLLQGQQQFEEQQRQQREEFAAGLQHQTARDVFQAQQESAMAQQRASLSVWANEQDLSNHERVQYARLQQSLSAWNGMRPQLNDEQYYEGLAQLQTHMSPLQMKIQKAKAEEDTARADELKQQAAHHATATKLFEQAMAGGGPPMAIDPHTQAQLSQEVTQEFATRAAAAGVPPQAIDQQAVQREVFNRARARGIPVWVMHKPGEWVQEKADAAGKGNPAREGRLDEAGYLKAYAEIESGIRHAILENMKLPPNMRDGTYTFANEAQLIADKLGGRGMAPNIESHRKAIEGGRVGGGATTNTPPPTNNTPPPADAPPPAPQKPFSLKDPATASPKQAGQLGEFGNIEAATNAREDLSPIVKNRVAVAVNTLKTLLAKAGSFDALAEDDQKRYRHAMMVINAVPARSLPDRAPAEEQARRGRYPSYTPAGQAGAPIGR